MSSASVMTTHTARKRYRCDDEPCRQMIEVGEQYARWVTLPGHDFLPPWCVNRQCQACQERRGYIGVIMP